MTEIEGRCSVCDRVTDTLPCPHCSRRYASAGYDGTHYRFPGRAIDVDHGRHRVIARIKHEARELARVAAVVLTAWGLSDLTSPWIVSGLGLALFAYILIRRGTA